MSALQKLPFLEEIMFLGVFYGFWRFFEIRFLLYFSSLNIKLSVNYF